jgi:pyruvate-formate lyase
MASDFDLLVQRGIPGLREDIAARRTTADDTSFLDGLVMSLDVFCNTCQWYAGQARTLGDTLMADDLEAIQRSAPRTFRQAVQLVWLYNLVAFGKHIEWPRMDVALGDLFASETRSGALTHDEAQRLLLGFWRLINENGEAAVCRITVGGRGRRNPENADLFALAAMDASRAARLITPQLTLRFHAGQNPALLERAYELIGAGCTYPLLYNDDVVIPGAMKALRTDEKTAEQYFPLGCGEYMIAHVSPSLLCLGWNIPQALGMALRNGRDFASFDDLYAAFMAQIENDAVLCAKRYEQICDFHKGRNPFLLASLLAHDCVERNAAIFDNGIRLLGACVMGHGYTNAADSLAAIKRIVFDEKRATLVELNAALENDFEGRDDLRRLCRDAPKFGNDDPAADALFAKMWEDIHTRVLAATATTRLGFFVASSVNPGGYYMGHDTGATADGRRAQMPFAIGNAPTAGNDAKGITALCNSVAKTCPASGGATTNFKLSRELFKDNARFAKTVFNVYFANGGQQASITVVDQADLLAAKKNPELYPHIIVRVGGWSSRFIDCDANVQDDIIKRTFYA